MRAILFILILLVVIVIGAIATGFVDIRQTQQAAAPNIDASREGVAASGGQPPKFEVQTGAIGVGTGQATVPVPRLEVRPADGGTQPQAPQPQPQQPQPQQTPAGPATTDSTQQ